MTFLTEKLWARWLRIAGPGSSASRDSALSLFGLWFLARLSSGLAEPGGLAGRFRGKQNRAQKECGPPRETRTGASVGTIATRSVQKGWRSGLAYDQDAASSSEPPRAGGSKIIISI